MHGLRSDIDLSFLVGQELQQVCIGRHVATLCFGDNVSVCIECEIAHKSNLGEVTALYMTKLPCASMLVDFINTTIIKAYGNPPGTLVLEFSNKEVLEIYDSNTVYESYHITSGEKTIVV